MTYLESKQEKSALLFLVPWILGFLCFLAGPILASLYLSFTEFDGINNPIFIGLNNYQEMLRDPVLLTSLKVTLAFACINLPLGTLVALGMALLLNQKISGLGFYRACLYLPSIVPIVASSVIWTWIFKPDETGLVNKFLGIVFSWLPGFTSPMWLADPNWALPALVIMSFWSLGNPMIIYLAGLQNIPQSLYESAEIDGASE